LKSIALLSLGHSENRVGLTIDLTVLAAALVATNMGRIARHQLSHGIPVGASGAGAFQAAVARVAGQPGTHGEEIGLGY
jgi:hypothetical protein